MSGSSPATNQVHRTSTDTNWTSSEQNACQSIAIIHPAGAFFRWSLFQVLYMHKTFWRIEQILPDKEHIRRMRNRHRRMRNGQETEMNGLKILYSVGCPLTLSGKVRQPLYRNHPRDLSGLMTKPTKWHVCPAKTQIGLGIRPVWSVFAVCMKKAWALSYPLSAQRRLWADAQADLSLLWVHMPFCWFSHEVAHFSSSLAALRYLVRPILLWSMPALI